MKVRVSGLLFCIWASVSAHGVLLLSAWSPPLNWAPAQGRAASLRVFQVVPLPPAPIHQLLLEPLAVEPSRAVAVSALPAGDDSVVDPSPLPRLPVGDETGYIPRPRLSVPPALLQPVALVWPSEALWTGHFTEILTLYIDEQGLVQRVEAEEKSGMPEDLRDIARRAFLGVSFTPGQLNGVQVKSKIRIEVSFGADPTAQSKGGQR